MFGLDAMQTKSDQATSTKEDAAKEKDSGKSIRVNSFSFCKRKKKDYAKQIDLFIFSVQRCPRNL